MSAGIVDHLELVKVQIENRMVPANLSGGFQSKAQASFELGPIDQSSKRVVAGLGEQECESRRQRVVDEEPTNGPLACKRIISGEERR